MALTVDIFWGTGYLGGLPQPVSEGGEGKKEPASKSSRARRALDGLVEGLRASGLAGTQYVEQYLRQMYRRNRRPNTLKTNCAAAKSFLGFVQGRGKTHLEMITREDLEAFVEHEQDRGLSPLSIQGRVTNVRSYLRFLSEAQVVRAEVLSKPIRIKVPEALPRAMDPQDVSRLLGTIDHVRDRAMVLVLLRTGMRIGELLETKVQDVELSERRILIWEAQKNRVGRVVYLSDDAREALMDWLGSRDVRREVLFYGQGRETMSYTAARMRLRRYLEKAGLMDKGYSLHCLRHSFATGLLNAGMRIECLQQLLGHSNLEITRRYARLSDRTREEEYFKAMAVIERGPSDGRYQLDRELQAALEEEELLSPHGQDVPACH